MTLLCFNLFQYLEQIGALRLVPEHAPGPSSQVLPGGRVRHPLGSKKVLVRFKGHFCVGASLKQGALSFETTSFVQKRTLITRKNRCRSTENRTDCCRNNFAPQCSLKIVFFFKKKVLCERKETGVKRRKRREYELRDNREVV